MSISELLTGGVSILLIASLLIQVTPIKVNPWTAIAKWFGKTMNKEVLDKISENSANDARYRIIRFDDEIRHRWRHTEEHFNQILDDINKYEHYCNGHPDYQNCKAVAAIKNIKEIYAKCRKENDFFV